MPKLKASAPGYAWKNGFFSIGSHWSAADVTPRDEQLAAPIEADFADAHRPLGNRAFDGRRRSTAAGCC